MKSAAPAAAGSPRANPVQRRAKARATLDVRTARCIILPNALESWRELLEHKTLSRSCMDERIDDRLEQALRTPRILGDPADEPRLHHRRLPHHHEEPAADRELALEPLVRDGERGCHGDRVVTLVGIEASRILGEYLDVSQAERGDVPARE